MALYLLTLVEWYGYVGIALAIAFLFYGLDRIDPSASGAYVVRVLFLPGVILLWPLVAVRWWQLEMQSQPPKAKPPL